MYLSSFKNYFILAMACQYHTWKSQHPGNNWGTMENRSIHNKVAWWNNNEYDSATTLLSNIRRAIMDEAVLENCQKSDPTWRQTVTMLSTSFCACFFLNYILFFSSTRKGQDLLLTVGSLRDIVATLSYNTPCRFDEFHWKVPVR